MKLPFKLDMGTLVLVGIGAFAAYTFMKNQEVKANMGYFYGERRLWRDSGISNDPHPNIEWTTSRVTPA
jgi:hypothetical protein